VTPVLIFAALVIALAVVITTAHKKVQAEALAKPATKMTFPVDPYAGDEYQTSNGRWQFDGQAWRQK
jgi:hypothetical protein